MTVMERDTMLSATDDRDTDLTPASAPTQAASELRTLHTFEEYAAWIRATEMDRRPS
jgi:hypothetical protein